jgi:cell division protease FtsH
MQGVVQKPDYSEATATKIDEEVNHLINEAFDRATRLLKDHRNHLDRVAALLIEREEVNGKEVTEILKAA